MSKITVQKKSLEMTGRSLQGSKPQEVGKSPDKVHVQSSVGKWRLCVWPNHTGRWGQNPEPQGQTQLRGSTLFLQVMGSHGCFLSKGYDQDTFAWPTLKTLGKAVLRSSLHPGKTKTKKQWLLQQSRNWLPDLPRPPVEEWGPVLSARWGCSGTCDVALSLVCGREEPAGVASPLLLPSRCSQVRTHSLCYLVSRF